MSSTVKSPQTRLQTRKSAASGTRNTQRSGISQQFVVLNITATLAVLIVTVLGYCKYHRNIIRVPKLPNVTDRLVYTIQLQTFSLIPLVISLVQVMTIRFFTTAINPLSGNEHLVEKPLRILQNTLEQFSYSFVNQLVLVTFLPAEHLFVVPLLVFLFTLGRVVFLIGYTIHPKYRSFGVVLTFFPTTLVFIANLLYVTGLNKHLFFISSDQPTKRVDL